MEATRGVAAEAHELGLRLMREGNWEQALAWFDYVLTLAPDSTEAYDSRATCPLALVPPCS